MKKIAAFLGFVLFNATADAGDTWKVETFESGESVYLSSDWGVFNRMFLIGERGISILYATNTYKSLAGGDCLISFDNSVDQPCELFLNDRMSWSFKDPARILSHLANSKKVILKGRVCENKTPACRYAIKGGSFETINTWEWDEPLSTTFPDFKTYKVK